MSAFAADASTAATSASGNASALGQGFVSELNRHAVTYGPLSSSVTRVPELLPWLSMAVSDTLGLPMRAPMSTTDTLTFVGGRPRCSMGTW